MSDILAATAQVSEADFEMPPPPYRIKVGWYRLTESNPALKAPMVSALETIIWMNCFQTLLSI